MGRPKKVITVKEISEIDKNLAINYYTMEQAAKATGVYPFYCDEYKYLPDIFKAAKKGKLSGYISNAESTNIDNYETFINVMQNLFGVSKDIVLGKRQIELGIIVEPKDKFAVQRAYASISEALDFIDNAYDDEILYTFSFGTDQVIYDAIDNSMKGVISTFTPKNGRNGTTTNEAITLKHILTQFESNPAKINHLFLFVDLYENDKIAEPEKEEKLSTEDLKDWHNIQLGHFNPIGMKSRQVRDKRLADNSYISREQKNQYTKKIKTIYSWRRNIYSLSCMLIYYVVKNKYLAYGHADNSTEFKSYLEFKDDIKDAEPGLPYPLIFTDGSELEAVLHYLLNKDYPFDFSYLKSVIISSVEVEINHTQDEILRLKMVKKMQTEFGRSTDETDSEMEMLEEYMVELLQEQADYEIDPNRWTNSKIKHISNMLRQLEQLADKINHELKMIKLSNQKVIANDADSILILYEMIEIEIEILEKWKKSLLRNQSTVEGKQKKVKNYKGKPMIRVREPYSKFMTLTDSDDDEDDNEDIDDE